MADDNLERITILLQARDRDLTRALDRMNRQIARVTRQGSRDTQRFQRRVEDHLNRAGQSALNFARNFAAGLAGGAVATAFGMFTTNARQVVRDVAAIGDQAELANLGIEDFQRWGYVAQQNRIGLDVMADGFKELSLRADEFVTTGSGSAAEALRRLGFTGEDLARRLRDPSELMLEIIRRMQGLDAAAQVRVADEIFGGSAGERFVQLVDQGATGIRRMRDEADAAGAVMDEALVRRAEEIDRRFNEIAATISNLAREGVVRLADSVVDVFTTDELEQRAQDLLQLASAAHDAEADMWDLARAAAEVGDQETATQILEVGRALMDIASAFRDGEADGDDLVSVLSQVVTRAGDALAGIESVDDVNLSEAERVIAGLTGLLAQLGAQAAATAEQVAAATMVDQVTFGTPLEHAILPQDTLGGRRSRAPRRAPALLGEPGVPPATGGGGGGGSGGGGFAGAVADIRARAEALNIEALSLASVAASSMDYARAADFARTRAELINEAMAEGMEITGDLESEIDAIAEAYVRAGATLDDVRSQMEQMRADSDRGVNAVTDLFMAIGQGSDAARSALARLLADMARMQAMRAFQSLAGGSGGGVFGFLGSLLTGKRATGGPVAAGQAYLVNESTPNSEVFVPSRSGGVLNVPQAQAALRGAAGASQVQIMLTPGLVGEIVKTSVGQSLQIVQGRMAERDRTQLQRLQASQGRVG